MSGPLRPEDTVSLRALDSICPSGAIVLWSGAADTIPEGWRLCDGTGGTPDLRDRFVVGAGKLYAAGDTGGEAEHTLTVDEMPSHSHMTRVVHASGSETVIYTALKSTGTWTDESSYTGGSQPHNNLPPYYALCYIMRL